MALLSRLRTYRDLFGYVAIALAGLSAAALYWYLYVAPVVLRVAVAPAGSEVAELFAAMATASERERLRIRLVIAPYTNLVETSAAIDAGDADLAIVRSDFRLPSTGLAVAVVHQNIAILLACPAIPRTSVRPRAGAAAPPAPAKPIQGFADLRGRRVAVLGRGPANLALFDKLAAYHGISARDADVIALQSAAEVAAASATKPVDAIFISPARGDRFIVDAIHALKCPGDVRPVVVPLAESAVLATRNKIFSSVELVAGEFGANPPMPPETVATLGFPSILVSRNSLSSSTVEEFTKQLFNQRQSLVTQYPSAGRFEALPTDRGSSFALHPGAAAYYDADSKGLFETYETLIYIVLFGASGIISGALWLLGFLFPKKKRVLHTDHNTLSHLIDKARQAKTDCELDEITVAADHILQGLSERMLEGEVDMELKPAFDMISERLAVAIAEQRSRLAAQHGVGVSSSAPDSSHDKLDTVSRDQTT